MATLADLLASGAVAVFAGFGAGLGGAAGVGPAVGADDVVAGAGLLIVSL